MSFTPHIDEFGPRWKHAGVFQQRKYASALSTASAMSPIYLLPLLHIGLSFRFKFKDRTRLIDVQFARYHDIDLVT